MEAMLSASARMCVSRRLQPLLGASTSVRTEYGCRPRLRLRRRCTWLGSGIRSSGTGTEQDVETCVEYKSPRPRLQRMILHLSFCMARRAPQKQRPLGALPTTHVIVSYQVVILFRLQGTGYCCAAR